MALLYYAMKGNGYTVILQGALILGAAHRILPIMLHADIWTMLNPAKYLFRIPAPTACASICWVSQTKVAPDIDGATGLQGFGWDVA